MQNQKIRHSTDLFPCSACVTHRCTTLASYFFPIHTHLPCSVDPPGRSSHSGHTHTSPYPDQNRFGCRDPCNRAMNNHIYSTLFKTQEREPNRRSKEIEQRKESQNTHTNKTTRTCDPKYRTTIYCINVKFPSSLNGLLIFF